MGSDPGLSFFVPFFSSKWDKKWVLACQSFGECTTRVKLELTDFNNFEGKMQSLWCKASSQNQLGIWDPGI